MNKPMSISVSRGMAVLLTVALVYGSIAPAFLYAQTATTTPDETGSGQVDDRTDPDSRLEERSNPPPADVCPNVSGDQQDEPCADTVCEADGGTWGGESCLPADQVATSTDATLDTGASTTTPTDTDPALDTGTSTTTDTGSSQSEIADGGSESQQSESANNTTDTTSAAATEVDPTAS